MTTNQMDVLAGVMLHNWYKDAMPESMTYKELIQCYESIRNELSYWNEVLSNEQRGMEDERAE